MIFSRICVGGSLAIVLFALAGASRADWAQSADPAVVRPAPGSLQVQPQNPPSFAWARHPSKPAAYVLEIQGASGTLPLVTVSRNWYLPAKAFAAGAYSWRVRPATSTDWSALRSFVIAPSPEQVFEVPDDAAMGKLITERGRPRLLPRPFALLSEWGAPQKAERYTTYTALRGEVLWRKTALAPVLDAEFQIFPLNVNSAAKNEQSTKMGQRISTTGRQLEASALLYLLTKERQFLDEALLRGDNLASLSLTGATGYINQDQASRQIALSLIKGADLLWNELNTAADPERRARWLNTVRTRTNDMYADLAGNDGRMDQYPFDSHGGSNLGYLAVIAVLALDDIADAQTWFHFAFRSYANIIYAWSGPEGGFANGTAYAGYTADIALQLWQPMTQASGINFFAKPWSTGFLKYLAYFLPPGATQNVFGDEHEKVPDFRIMKAFAARFNSPLAAWYAANISGAEDWIVLLQAPFPLPVATALRQEKPANAALFPSIGWAAMHSDIADKARTSLYFKSSPYGAYNHSHGDQNGFVLSSGGRPLLIETGYQDYYGSPLTASWYRQTKAHNGITFDGGVGQLVTGNTENLTRNGRITGFSTTAALDYVEGDALAAYGPVLSSAKRQLWYLRAENAFVVRDKLTAPAPHQFEWNFHAPVAIVAGEGEYLVKNGDQQVCLRSLGSVPVAYEKRSGPPPPSGKVEDHAAFVLPSATSAEFLVLLDVGCKRPAAKLTATATGWTLQVGSQSIVLAQ
ncbi:heparinase II/III family protein [Massilia sp. BJB1822]|uniref:heparinase II/III domain-containing protein n=1 Tax=Massilia sp. BJB1822 TaxID=2744470 RepID=UPI001593DC4D|nr:heparinase II/III family protein [Massilia sp. BJB1822]NVE00002.1 heparinase II/III family protein [Massilia sp. BJB1822]